MIIHAGAYVFGSARDIPRYQIVELVERGFVVVTPDFRLCPQVSIREGPWPTRELASAGS